MAGLIQRGRKFYATYYAGDRERRVSLQTDSLQLAKEKLRQLESSLARGDDNPFPTRTPIAEVLEAYVAHLRVKKTAQSAQSDIYYLRGAFGAVCPALVNTSRRLDRPGRLRPRRDPADRRRNLPTLEAACFEAVTTAQVSAFIAGQVQAKGLAPKSANRLREVLHRVYNWAMREYDIRLPNSRNPVTLVSRYKEKAPDIRFLTLDQIAEQLRALTFQPQMQAMVAMLIYAGLRREEALWLRVDDVDFHTGPRGTLRVRAKEVNGDFWQPKTRQNRAVPISAALRSILDRYTPPPSDDAWYFPSPQGCLYDPDNFSRDLRAAQAEAGLIWTCLDFRHTFGSQLAAKGESLYKIATLMGNSPEICRRHYAALAPESLCESVEFPIQIPARAAAHAI